MSVHYWAPTVLSPDGKPFDKKLIKVLLGMPVVHVLIIVPLWRLFFFPFSLLLARVYISAETTGNLCFLSKDSTSYISNILGYYAPPCQTLALVFHLVVCMLIEEGIWVMPRHSVRTFTMPSGQSGRTLWNVPKLSNRFQVLQATGQPPAISPLCVLCDKSPCSTVKAPPFLLKERGQRNAKWIPTIVYRRKARWKNK